MLGTELRPEIGLLLRPEFCVSQNPSTCQMVNAHYSQAPWTSDKLGGAMIFHPPKSYQLGIGRQN